MSSEWGVEQSPAHDKCYGGIDAHKYQRKYAVYVHDPIAVHDCTRTWLFTHLSGEEASFLMPSFNNNIFPSKRGRTRRFLANFEIEDDRLDKSDVFSNSSQRNVRDKFVWKTNELEQITWRDDRAPISCKTVITYFHDPEQFPVERSIFLDDKTPLSRIRISRLRNKGSRKALGRSISFAVIKTFDEKRYQNRSRTVDNRWLSSLRYSLSPSTRKKSRDQFFSRVYSRVCWKIG